MCYTLLHPNDNFQEIWAAHPEWNDCYYFSELEKLIWDFGFEEPEEEVKGTPGVPLAVLGPEPHKEGI
jgi:hypothetical protein